MSLFYIPPTFLKVQASSATRGKQNDDIRRRTFEYGKEEEARESNLQSQWGRSLYKTHWAHHIMENWRPTTPTTKLDSQFTIQCKYTQERWMFVLWFLMHSCQWADRNVNNKGVCYYYNLQNKINLIHRALKC